MPSPDYRAELRRVFGPNALGWALFYAHEPALRFELSRGGGYVDMFTQAYDRGRELLHAIFDASPELVVVFSFHGAGRLEDWRPALRSIRACGIDIPRPYQVWTEDVAGFEEPETWTYLAFRAGTELIDRLIWGVAAAELGIRPRLRCNAYIADAGRGLLAHAYDDRGMDVIGREAHLRELYKRFDAYLLDYDWSRMDAWFEPRIPG